MWSIGNEIDYPDDPFTHPRGRGFDPSVPRQPDVKQGGLSADLMPAIARRLIAAVKGLDTTRPVTMALADINASNATGVANMLDVVGYNYLEQFYERDHKAYPNRVIYGSENSLRTGRVARGRGQRLGGRAVPVDGDELPGRSGALSGARFQLRPARSAGLLEARRVSAAGAVERHSRWSTRRRGIRARTRRGWRTGSAASGAFRRRSDGASPAIRARRCRWRSTRIAIRWSCF